MNKIRGRAFISVICVIIMLCTLVSCTVTPYSYELKDYVYLPGDWVGMTVSEAEVSVRVNEKITEIRMQAAIIEEVLTRPARSDDLVKLNLKCYYAEDYGKGGTPIEIISDAECEFVVGKGKYPIELETAVIGRYKDDKIYVRCTLPQNYTVGDLAGVAVVLEAQVLSVSERKMPLFNDAFVSTVSGYATVEEYKQELFLRMKEEIVWENLLRDAEVKQYPEEELDLYISDYISFYTDVATENGMTLEQYVGKKYFMSLNAFHKEAESYAKETVKEELLMYYIEREYNVKVTDEEYETYAQKYVKQYGVKSLKELESKFGKEYIKKTVVYDKVLEYVTENTVYVEDVV